MKNSLATPSTNNALPRSAINVATKVWYFSPIRSIAKQFYHSFENLSSSKAYASLEQPLPWHLTLWRSDSHSQKESDLNKFLEPRTYNLERYVLWVEIESIEYIGYEQVYDIEVEGTHNFVANGIIAHNTYLSGNVGIGTTGPTAKLQVQGGDLALQTTKKVILDSNDTSDTYLAHDATNNWISYYIDGTEAMRIKKR